MMQWLSVVVTTIVCAIVMWGLTLYVDLGSGGGPPGLGAPHVMLAFLGGVFGFWLSYTDRLARIFRKVGR
jgi:hypothetical protein